MISAAGKNQSISENDIRPDALMDEQKKRMLADIDYLLGFRDQFVDVPCPACQSDDYEDAFEKYTLTYRACRTCDTLYISPRPTPDILGKFYANSVNYEYWATHIFPASEAARTEKIFRPRAERVKDLCAKYNMTPETMVEIGAGFGTFGQEIKKLNLVDRFVAVEPSTSLAQKCRDRGLETLAMPIEETNFDPESVDVICSFEVIEHLFDPAAIFETCHRILKPGGLVIVTNPSGHGFDVIAAPEHSTTVDVEHLNYFNPGSMQVMLEKKGFEVVEVMTPGVLDAELVHKMFTGGQMTRENNPFLYQILVEKWDEVKEDFQNFLVKHNLSSHMWTIARKV